MDQGGDCCCCSWLVGLAAVLIILFYTSTRVNFILKVCYLYLAYMVMGIFVSVLCLPRPRNLENGVICAKIMSTINRMVGIKWELEGIEKLVEDRGAVVVINHQSSIDILGIMEMWPHMKRAAPVAKKSLMYLGPFGLAAWLVGVVFIDRSSKSSRNDVNSAGIEAKLNRTKLLVFPEGTRNDKKDLSLLPFKKGAFHVALDAEMPIIPVVISEYDFLDTRKMIFRPGTARVKVLDPVDVTEFSKSTINELVDTVRDKMAATLKEISTPMSEEDDKKEK